MRNFEHLSSYSLVTIVVSFSSWPIVSIDNDKWSQSDGPKSPPVGLSENESGSWETDNLITDVCLLV